MSAATSLTSLDASVSYTTFRVGEFARGVRRTATWRELLASMLKPQECSSKENCDGWSPAIFRGDRRKLENLECASALGFDIDQGNVEIDALAECFPATIGVIHSTYSSAPGSRRWRIFLALSRPVTAIEYARLWRFVSNEVLGTQTADENAKDASRFWFVPAAPIGHTEEFASRMLEGELLDVNGILAALSSAPTLAGAPVESENAGAANPQQLNTNEEPWLARIARSTRIDRASKWASYAEPAIERDHGSDRAMRAATALTCGFALSVDDAVAVFSRDYNPRCVPPWSDAEIRHKIFDAAKAARMPWGEKLKHVETTETPRGEITRCEEPAWDSLVTPVCAEWFSQAPPKRDWLLRDSRRASFDGVLPLGKSGLLVAEGGAGKTMALVQLAIAVATGSKWFDALSVPAEGRVLVCLGEEDKAEAQRRFYDASRHLSTRPSPSSIDILPLLGTPCALLERDPRGQLKDSAFATWLRSYVEKSGPWSLIILDPLSRFAGPGAETDNAEATRFVQSVESLCAADRTVLVAHHTNQLSRGGVSVATSGARGVTALTDGFRWVASMAAQDVSKRIEDAEARERLGRVVTLSFTKSNYSKLAEPLALRRLEGGPLAPLDSVDRAIVGQACDGSIERDAKKAARDAERDQREAERATKDAAARAAKQAAKRAEQLATEQAEERAMLEILTARPGLFGTDLRIAMAAKLHGCSHNRVDATVARLGDQLRIERRANNAKAYFLSSAPIEVDASEPPPQPALAEGELPI